MTALYVPLYVINQISEGLGLSLKSEALEHWWDSVVGQEGQGHRFPYVSVDSIVAGVCHLKAELLNL